jgi:hypothetical protein
VHAVWILGASHARGKAESGAIPGLRFRDKESPPRRKHERFRRGRILRTHKLRRIKLPRVSNARIIGAILVELSSRKEPESDESSGLSYETIL